ncbi:MAG: STAS domain-containing protein [Bacilli bacterium]|nr:STAS domain-containing protein [Bacilli bacterium]
MNIIETRNGEELVLALEGNLDTSSYEQLESVISSSLEGVKSLVLDFAKLDYVSSAGLRILLISQKKMNAQGKMTLRNVNNDIMDIFEMTGFLNILNIEH